MIATTRPAAKFIEKTRDLFPGMIYSNVSAVGASSLAEELMLLGPRFTQGVIVTQTVPAVSGYSSVVLEYKNALAKYFPGESPDYISLEGFISANVLIDAIWRCGPAARDRDGWSTFWRTPAISMSVLASRSVSAAASTRPRTRSGERRSTKPASISRSNLNDLRGARPRKGSGASVN